MADRLAEMEDLKAMVEEPLHPDLAEWVEEGQFGPMLRHPLVYSVPLMMPGYANRSYAYKQRKLAEAIEEKDWHSVVFLHERPHRLNALIEYVTGRDEYGDALCVVGSTLDVMELVADVWVDSENINQNLIDWRALICNGEGGLWLGTQDEQTEFDALSDPIAAYRGGSVGDWSWTTDIKIAKFFANRSDLTIRGALIPKADCFGYLTRRGESELLVRLTDERRPLVYPEGEPDA
jgi:hypothetical protein